MILEESLDQTGGEITDEMDVIWQEKDASIKQKLDNYGYLFVDLDKDEDKLKTIKEKVQSGLKRVEKVRARLKARLHYLSEGKPLRGTLFSFHPYQTAHKVIGDPTKLSSSESYLTIEIRKDHWESLLSSYNDIPWEPDALEYSIKKESARVSELPENHPAITIINEPSVRMT